MKDATAHPPHASAPGPLSAPHPPHHGVGLLISLAWMLGVTWLCLYLAACSSAPVAPTVVSSSVNGKVFTSVVIPPPPRPTLTEQLLGPLSALASNIAPYLLSPLGL